MSGRGRGLNQPVSFPFPTFACKIFATSFQQRAAVIRFARFIIFDIIDGFSSKEIPFCICRRDIYLFILSQLILTKVELHVWCIFSFLLLF